MVKSLGEGYTLYRKGNVIAVAKENKEIARFPIGYEVLDILVNPQFDEIQSIQCKLRHLKENCDKFGEMKTGDIASFDKRINALEELLQSGKNVTVHSRLNDMEKEICALRKLKEDLESVSYSNSFVQQTHKHDVSITHLERKMKIVEDICKNIDTSLKCLEGRFDRIDKNMNVIDMEWHHMKDGLTGMVRNILKSL